MTVENEQILKIGLPKGSLQEATLGLFRKAGWHFVAGGRSYVPSVDDTEIEPLLIRPQEMPQYVEQGILDCGLTGFDWVQDNGSSVRVLSRLTYGKQTLNPIRIVLAAQKGGPIQTVKDLEGKRIASEYVRLTQRYLQERGVTAKVEFSWGADEVKVPDLVDAIVVNTETGSSLRAHNLFIIEQLMESTTVFVCNEAAWENPWKRAKMESMVMLLEGALHAEKLVGLKMNVPKAAMARISSLLPALKKPTVSPLADDEWVAVEVILDERTVRDLIPKLKRAGAEGLVEYPLNKVIY
ncbi:MAG TPA: ATP phosphoribosyltransferase [Armatimonadota bacterium]|jgi:ATP phosphoribosyltransferase